MKKILTLGLLAIMLLLAGCQSATVPALEGAARDEVLAYADPIAENLLTGLKNGDYAAFSADFNQAMLDAITEQKFQELRGQLDPRIGQFVSKEVQKVEDRGELVTVTYRGEFEKAKNVRILLTLEKAAPHRVSGLYFQ